MPGYGRSFFDYLMDQIDQQHRGPDSAPTPPPRRVYRYTLRDGTVVSVETTSDGAAVRAAALRAVARSLDP